MAGANDSGQLGDGTAVRRSTGVQVATDVTAVFAGYGQSFWIKNDGTLWATGDNEWGQLGDGGTGKRYLPTQVATDVLSVSSYGTHTAFLKKDGTLWTMGANYNGQLGIGSVSASRSTPGQVATDVAAIATGYDHTLFLKNDGTLWGMGANFQGQLGDGIDQTSPAPKQIATDVKAIASTGSHSLFVKRDGTLWAMGSNEYGQLGDGTTSKRRIPVQVASNVETVAAGSTHSVFVKTDGTVWAVGSNLSGQLAEPLLGTRYIPVQVRNDVDFITAGGEHTLFRTRDGTLWGAGSNRSGEFGLGSETYGAPYLVKLVGSPELTAPPVSKTVNPNTNVTFSVTAWGAAPLTYQWRRNGQLIPGATTAKYSFTAQKTDEGSFDVIVGNQDGTVTAEPVTLSVNDPVVITSSTQSMTRMPGQRADFNVIATGTGPLNYQWRKNGSVVPAASGSSFSIASVSTADNGTYTCTVSNAAGSEASVVIVLSVGPAIIAQPQSKTVNPGPLVTFYVTASGSALTYQWRLNGVPLTDATFSSYSISAFQAYEGNYDVVISNAGGSVISNTAVLHVNKAVSIVSAPQSISVMPGQLGTLAVTATGDGDLSYQWRRYGIPLTGETKSTLRFTNITEAQAGTYTCAVSNMVGTVVSAVAEIRVGPEITTQPVSQIVSPGNRVDFSVGVKGSAPFTYEWRKNGIAIASGSALTILSANEEDEGEYTVLVSNAAGSVLTERTTLRVNDLPKITIQPKAQEIEKGTVVTFGVQVQGTGLIAYQWRKDGVEIAGANHAFLLIGPVNESHVGTYDVVATDSIGSVTSASASLTLNLRPRILRQPASLAARPGATVSFSVEATGADPLSYQWFRNGAPLANATSATLTIENLSPDSIGDYRVRISNDSGAVLSDTAVVGFAEWQTVAGIYQGLLVNENAGEADAIPWSGRLTVTVTNAGALSGRLEYEGQTLSFTGVLNKDFSFAKAFNRKSQAPLLLRLRFEGTDETLRASVEAGTLVTQQTATLSAVRHTFHAKQNPAPQAGRYVVALLPGLEAGDAPTAPGYATVQITTGGAVSMVGKLPDGAKIAIGGYLGEDSVFGCYQALYRPVYPESGQLAGLIGFEPTPTLQAVSGSLHWWKPKQTSGMYSNGFRTLLPLRGAFYIPPSAGEVAMETPQGSSGLELSVEAPRQQLLIQRALMLSPRNAFQLATPNPEKAALKLDVRTGLIKGSFFDSATRKTRILEGVIIPPASEACGFFTRDTQSGSWSITPF